VPLSDTEAGVAAGRAGVCHFEVLDARAGRAVAQLVLEPVERLRLPFCRDFDATVRKVTCVKNRKPTP
jgi:hypothetical protein